MGVEYPSCKSSRVCSVHRVRALKLFLPLLREIFLSFSLALLPRSFDSSVSLDSPRSSKRRLSAGWWGRLIFCLHLHNDLCTPLVDGLLHRSRPRHLLCPRQRRLCFDLGRCVRSHWRRLHRWPLGCHSLLRRTLRRFHRFRHTLYRFGSRVIHLCGNSNNRPSFWIFWSWNSWTTWCWMIQQLVSICSPGDFLLLWNSCVWHGGTKTFPNATDTRNLVAADEKQKLRHDPTDQK